MLLKCQRSVKSYHGIHKRLIGDILAAALLGLADKGASSYLVRNRTRAMKKAHQAIRKNQNIELDKLHQLSIEKISYGSYIVKTLNNNFQTIQRMKK